MPASWRGWRACPSASPPARRSPPPPRSAAARKMPARPSSSSFPPSPSAIFPPRSSKASAADALRPAAPCAWRAVPGSLSHHLSLGVCDILRAAAFYDAVLAPLGYARVWSVIRPGEPGQAVGYGPPGGGDKPCLKDHGTAATAPGPGFHIAFAAPSRGAVDAFHRAALAAGATMAHPDCASPTARPTMPPSSSIRTNTASKPSARTPRDRPPAGEPFVRARSARLSHARIGHRHTRPTLPLSFGGTAAFFPKTHAAAESRSPAMR
ncbi:protein of unknown function [Shinella sp. WSC3-e]|nr:hypothetical protein SHINE37_44369 [Rhizobiaceae bacterium]CAK7258864.1 protein of unknown function [Shinella sp. WSC3-e]